MDEYAMELAQAVHDQVEFNDTKESYSYAMGMRHALELYIGVNAARELLFSLGHEY